MADFEGLYESLPTEIRLGILDHLSDLETLDSLIRASPADFRVFAICGTQVLDRILDAGFTHQRSCDIIRNVALIRQGGFPITSLSELQRQVTSIALMSEQDRSMPYLPVFQLPANLTPEVMYSILATARRITFQTLDCLDVHLQRFLQVAPYVSGDPIQMEHHTVESILEMAPDDPAAVQFECWDIGPPTWAEEQLVYRAFWRIQLVEDLRRAVNVGLVTGWSDEEREKLNELSLLHIYDFEEMVCLASLTYNLAEGPGFDDYQELVEQGVVLTVLGYLEFLRVRSLSPTPLLGKILASTRAGG
ncbi:hypothetical protein K461DRAFT_161221 [Myriangium duriaei CBS 260.36]|uniref:F-box domain-containing protein n=1 Tax=Myriangium duriaei CBS 260.36 TaxID=1168546 RepID=A0A9P4IYS3_9PEZI|nr:hypothetical protein K461DRAFT_161221 [Myriangium duriaei CBS 260.36]